MVNPGEQILTPAQQFIQLVLRYSLNRAEELIDDCGRLAHYTTAEKALLILDGKELWLRSASVMNDVKEVHHGIAVLKEALSDECSLWPRFIAVLDQIRPGLALAIRDQLHRFAGEPIETTFITSLAEIEMDDHRGLLSMWRAYGGGTAAVALVFNTDFLMSGPEELQCYGSPVFYGDYQKFLIELEKLIERLEQNVPLMQQLGGETVYRVLYFALEAAAVSMKHDGFAEEREWRVIHRPFTGRTSPWVEPKVSSIWGVPQIVYTLPLENKPGMNIPLLDLRNLLHRVIVGPSLHPEAVRLGFVQQLAELGLTVPEAYDRVRMSDIPLRPAH